MLQDQTDSLAQQEAEGSNPDNVKSLASGLEQQANAVKVSGFSSILLSISMLPVLHPLSPIPLSDLQATVGLD